MKSIKIFSIVAVAALFLTPTVAIAKSPKVSFFLNFDCFLRPPAPPPPICFEEHIVEEHYYAPCPPPYVERRTIIRRDYVGGYYPYCYHYPQRGTCPCPHYHY